MSLGDLKKKHLHSIGKYLKLIMETILKVFVLNECKIKKQKITKPVCILINTEMGCGVDFMMGSHKWHGIAPNDEQLEKH